MGQLNLLIVDDEEMLVESLARFFKRKDFNVLTAYGVEEARKVIKENPIQILITDMRMPDGQGTEVIGLQRQLHPASVILCATGFAEEDTQTILSKGANHVVGKPFEKKALLDLILKELGSGA